MLVANVDVSVLAVCVATLVLACVVATLVIAGVVAALELDCVLAAGVVGKAGKVTHLVQHISLSVIPPDEAKFGIDLMGVCWLFDPYIGKKISDFFLDGGLKSS